MEITLSNGTVVNVLLINVAQNYIDFEVIGASGHNRVDVELTDYASAMIEMTEALESALVDETL